MNAILTIAMDIEKKMTRNEEGEMYYRICLSVD
jgi:hypothetical protein